MVYFADRIVKPYIAASGYRKLAEIGSNIGLNSDAILELENVELTLIDPCLDLDLVEKYKDEPRATVVKDLSLNALPTLSEEFDAILIDGDHNWYTVFNELTLIHDHGLLRPGGTIFFHDTAWPYGRRDMYYQPETIPQEFRQPHAKRGIARDQVELAPDGVTDPAIIGAHLENAIKSGGPRNGVRTAIEDFVAAHPREYCFQSVDEQHGLGILLRASSPSANASYIRVLKEQQTLRRKMAFPNFIKRSKKFVKKCLPFLVPLVRKLKGIS